MMGFKEKWRHAFAVDTGEEEFTPEEVALLEKIAREVVKRRLETPALMFLESVRPLNFLGNQVMVFFQPIANFVVSPVEYERLNKILERRKSIPTLMDMIEKVGNERV